jgi:Helix-turn-helix domain
MICACPCKKEFEPKRANQKYRSKECKERARRERSKIMRLSAEEGRRVEMARMGRAAVVPRGNHPFPGYRPNRTSRRHWEPFEPLLTTADVARLLGVSQWQLRAWRMRSRGGGPAFVRIGRLVRYRPADLASFIRAGRDRNPADRAGRKRR